MRKTDVKVGETYIAKVSGRRVPVRIDLADERKGWWATNLITRRRVRILTAARLSPRHSETNVEVGKTYVARISGRHVLVRIDHEAEYGPGWWGTNLTTGRRVRIFNGQGLKPAGLIR